jgi:hypothetical protein
VVVVGIEITIFGELVEAGGDEEGHLKDEG